MSDEPVPDERPTCLNPDCTNKNPVKGKWCTARECKDMRALATKAKKAAELDKACKAIGVPLPAAQLVDGGLICLSKLWLKREQ